MHFQANKRVLSILLLIFMLYACVAPERPSVSGDPTNTVPVIAATDESVLSDPSPIPPEATATDESVLSDPSPIPPEATATDEPVLTDPSPMATEEDATDDPVTNADSTIRIDASATPQTFDQRLLGTNIPAWLGERLADSTFQARTSTAGVSIIRLPGGSWSNSYDWLGCETDDGDTCYWTWAARPTDFINYLRATGTQGMYTVSINGTAQEAAALVAFFNGSVDDTRSIGTDRRGRDWKTVGHWAQLRSDNGNPEPYPIQLWEIGNEVYGGKAGMGTHCEVGWEDVWTCDGTEYVTGIGSGSSGYDGYLAYREAMRAVDDSILVGAIGIDDQSGWWEWGNKVIAAAGSEMDFYSIHHYAYFTPPEDYAEVLTKPQSTWAAMMQNVQTAFDQYANGRQVPIALTEYNMFAWIDGDENQTMKRAMNALFLADTIGQMGQNGFAMANQWDLANGENGSGADYGLIHVDTYDRYPAYYIFPLWSRFGSQMLPVTSSFPADTTLSVYAGRSDATTLTLLAVNKTGNAITANIQLDGVTSLSEGTVDVLQAPSLDSQTVTFNGVDNPNDDLSDAPSQSLTGISNPLAYTFEPYSVTLIRLTTPVTNVPLTEQAYLPWLVSYPGLEAPGLVLAPPLESGAAQ